MYLSFKNYSKNNTTQFCWVLFFHILVRVVGVEPTRPFELRILSPVRLPFRHTRIYFD